MLFEVVLHDGYADPPTTYWIADIEGPNATVALQRNRAKVIEAAEELCGRCDEVHFTRRDLARLRLRLTRVAARDAKAPVVGTRRRRYNRFPMAPPSGELAEVAPHNRS